MWWIGYKSTSNKSNNLVILTRKINPCVLRNLYRLSQHSRGHVHSELYASANVHFIRLFKYRLFQFCPCMFNAFAYNFSTSWSRDHTWNYPERVQGATGLVSMHSVSIFKEGQEGVICHSWYNSHQEKENCSYLVYASSYNSMSALLHTDHE